MGLAICIGMMVDLLENDEEGVQWLEAELGIVNQLLDKAGLPVHTEPRTLPPLEHRASIGSFPYSFIHYLRRAYAQRLADPSWTASPLPDGVDPCDDPVLEAQGDTLTSHLLCHSDAEGFYVPVDFPDVIFAKEGLELAGGMLGSSYRLLDELVLVAPALGIMLEGGKLSDAEAARVDAIASNDKGLSREYCAWLGLYEAARLSIDLKTAIVFT